MKPMKNSISSELVSACSALNTEITCAPHLCKDDGSLVFISEAEPLAAHSIEHIHAAVDMLKDLQKDLNFIRSEIYKSNNINLFNKLDIKLRNIEQKL